MPGPLSQSPRDRILWVITEYGGKMGRSKLRRATGMRYELLNTILDELAREDMIKIASGKDKDLILIGNIR